MFVFYTSIRGETYIFIWYFSIKDKTYVCTLHFYIKGSIPDFIIRGDDHESHEMLSY